MSNGGAAVCSDEAPQPVFSCLICQICRGMSRVGFWSFLFCFSQHLPIVQGGVSVVTASAQDLGAQGRGGCDECLAVGSS